MTAEGVRVRPARSEDLAILQAVEAAAGARFHEVGMPEIADDDPPSIGDLAAAAAVLVAVDHEDRPVGYARVELVGGQSHLEQLSVVPEHGGRGIGKALLDAVAAWARARGDRAVTLTTFRSVPFNAPLYARRGYVELPEPEWSDALRALVAQEAAHGLDPATRVVMQHELCASDDG